MTTTDNIFRICCQLFLATLITLTLPLPLFAGETEVSYKTGYFTWSETIEGQNFVKEKGFLHALGVTRTDIVASRVRLQENLEIWGGAVDYDGHDVANTRTLASDTSYLGTTLEATAGYQLPLAENLQLTPFVGFGHKFWIRSRSSEDWNMIYTRAGAEVAYSAAKVRLFAKGGALLPLYTRNHAALSTAGYEDVVIEPENKVNLFAEGGIKTGHWTVSIAWETLDFGRSDNVSVNRTANKQNGVAVAGNSAYQPETESSVTWFRVGYEF